MTVYKHIDNKNIKTKIRKHAVCGCGSIVFESPKEEFRCSNCGSIKYIKEGS